MFSFSCLASMEEITAAVGGEAGGGREVTSGGTEGTGEEGTKGKGAAGCTGGRDGWGVECTCGRLCTEDPLGEEKVLAAARKEGRKNHTSVTCFSLGFQSILLPSWKIFQFNRPCSQELSLNT